MKHYIFMTLVLLSLVAFSQDSSISSSLETCRSIIDSEQRLACYDHIGGKEVETITDNAIKYAQMPKLIADLEEPRIFSSYGRMSFLDNDINAILLGVGTRLKLKNIEVPKTNHTLDFNMIGMVKSQFDVSELDTRNNRGGALINTDFMIGGELVENFKHGNLRLRYSHQSFHLGDEFIIDNPEYIENRLNLSYETVEVLGYRSFNNWTAYMGGAFIVRSEPGNLDKLKLQSGIQYNGNKHDWFTPLFGLDLKSWGVSSWHLNTSFKAGIEINGAFDLPLQLMFEYYDGKSPYGQFLNEDFSYLGFSISI